MNLYRSQECWKSEKSGFIMMELMTDLSEVWDEPELDHERVITVLEVEVAGFDWF